MTDLRKTLQDIADYSPLQNAVCRNQWRLFYTQTKTFDFMLKATADAGSVVVFDASEYDDFDD